MNQMDEKVDIPFIRDYDGSLVWLAILVSIGGLIISWFVGIKLPGLEYNNQKVEAAFRKDLVLGEDDKKKYANEETLWGLFTGIRFNYQRLFLHYGYFDDVNREYVIDRPDVPVSWTNYIGLEEKSPVPLMTETKLNHDLAIAADGILAWRAQIKRWDHIFVAETEFGAAGKQ